MKIVSVIIPVYNKEDFIEETLNSVLNQEFDNWECIVVDDGSKDQSLEIIKKFIANKPNFHLIIRPKERKKGASTCRNIGVENSQGEYIQFLDADDLLSKNKILQQVGLLNENNDFTISTCAWGRLRGRDFEKYEGLLSYSDFDDIPNFLNSLTSSYGYFPSNAYLFPRKLITIAGPWNENISLNDDGEYVMRLLCHCERVAFTSTAVAKYRMAYGNNLSSFENFKGVENAVYSWKLIDAHLKIKFGNKANKFIEWSKSRFFINLKNSYPELIQVHSDFFAKQIKTEKDKSGFFFRLKNKIEIILK